MTFEIFATFERRRNDVEGDAYFVETVEKVDPCSHVLGLYESTPSATL